MATDEITQSCATCAQPITGRRVKFCSRHCRNTFPVEKRFWQYVTNTEGCWLWRGMIHHTGYGYLYNGTISEGAHRIAFQLFRGPIPTGLFVCHTCDVRACVNPDHLWLGTNEENIRDRDLKGRTALHQGTENGKAKFTDQQIQAIRQDQRRAEDVAADYGVNYTTIHRIRRRVSWAHIV